MDFEVRSFLLSVKFSFFVKLREYKLDLNNFKIEVKRIMFGNFNVFVWDELLEVGMVDIVMVCVFCFLILFCYDVFWFLWFWFLGFSWLKIEIDDVYRLFR